MPANNLAEQPFITEADYLAAEALSLDKHEYLNGMVYPVHWNPVTNMAGASDAHVKVCLNTALQIKNHLRGSGCSTYMSNMRLKAGQKDKAYFYPDVMVTCDPTDRERQTMKESPVLVIEVLSASTRNYDRGDKFFIYRSFPSLREYALIDPDRYSVEVYRLNEHRRWELFSFEGAECVVEFASIGLVCTMQDLYEDVAGLA